MIPQKLCLLVSNILLFSAVASQNYHGVVQDSETGEPLPYANIGVRGKQIGGISDGKGQFDVDLTAATLSDVLIVSYVGYASQEFKISSLDLSRDHVIKLIARSQVLREVVVRSKVEVVVLGNKAKSSRHTGWGDLTSSRGRAIGLQIPEHDLAVQVNSVFFHLDACEFDSALVRVNFFSTQGSELSPFERQHENIFYTITQKKGWVEVKLPGDVVLRREKVIVAVEWVDAWAKPRTLEEGGSYLFTLSLAKVPGYSYLRQTPEENIHLRLSEFTPSIYLTCVPIQE